MSRTPIIAAATAVAAVAGGVVSGAAGQSGTPTTLDLTLRQRDARIGFVDAKPLHSKSVRHDSPGDQVILHSPVRATDGSKAGLLDAVFTTTATNDREQLAVTFTLGDSSIGAQGIDAAATTDTLAIVGGTGRYDGASGTLTATEGRGTIKFHLALAG